MGHICDRLYHSDVENADTKDSCLGLVACKKDRKFGSLESKFGMIFHYTLKS